MRSRYRLGIDAGGTFTDFVLADQTGRVRLFKVLSTPFDPTKAIRDGLQQIADDLGENADLIVNACSTFLFLEDPTFNRERYRKLFNLNEREIENLASLQPREALLKRAGYSKIIRLNLDPKSLWLFSTKPKDRVRRAREIELYGFDEAFRRQLTVP